MKNLMQFILLSCLRATELIEKQFIGKLSWIQKLQLRLHTSACQICSHYEEQSSIIHHTLLKHIKSSNQTDENGLKPVELEQLKQKIILHLEENKE